MIKRTLLALLMLLLPLASQAAPFWGAQESRPAETAPGDLKPGEYVWNVGVAPDGPIVVLVSLGEQRAYVYRNGVQIGFTTISTGKGGYETPTGVFVVLQKDKDHRSKTYNNAPMPYTQRLTWSGVALHAGGLPGYPSSHGCIHLPSTFSEELFAVSPMGMTVVVVDESTAPPDVAHPPAFAPVDASTGVARVPDRLAPTQEFRLEPEKSEHGPVSIVISAADRRALVLRNGVEIGRAASRSATERTAGHARIRIDLRVPRRAASDAAGSEQGKRLRSLCRNTPTKPDARCRSMRRRVLIFPRASRGRSIRRSVPA